VSQGLPFRIRTDGILLRVRLTPRASRDHIDGTKDGPDGAYVQARVRAVPENGRANVALAELVASEIGVPKSTVTLATGQTARLKSLHIAGNAADLEKRIMAWLKRFE
jgi:uncharacterized protein YggU (UPF0235/DUF167 family)